MRDKTREGGGGGSYVIHAREGTDASFRSFHFASMLPVSPVAVYFLISAKHAGEKSSGYSSALPTALIVISIVKRRRKLERKSKKEHV